jgi:hypothetical protein
VVDGKTALDGSPGILGFQRNASGTSQRRQRNCKKFNMQKYGVQLNSKSIF